MPSISVRGGLTHVLIGWAQFAIAKAAPQGTKTLLIKERAKRKKRSPSLRWQVMLTQCCNSAVKLVGQRCWQVTSLVTDLIVNNSYLSALKLPSQEFKSCGTKDRQTKRVDLVTVKAEFSML